MNILALFDDLLTLCSLSLRAHMILTVASHISGTEIFDEINKNCLSW